MLRAIGYQGIENHLPSLSQITLKRPNLIFSPQQKICNCEVKLLIDIPGFLGIDFEHHRFFPDAMMSLDQVFAGKNIKARILFINRRQVLGLDQNGRIMIDGAAVLKI